MIQKLQDPSIAAPLFQNWNETMIWSALQGIMGEIYANETLTSAVAVAGDFCFFAGIPDRELIEMLMGTPFIIATPQNEDWGALIKAVHGTHAASRERYAIRKEPNGFNRDQLQKRVSALPEGYTLHPIEKELYELCKQMSWSQYLVSQYPTYESYKKLGLGVAVVYNGELVAGASSYYTYKDGIEIEIDTRNDHRRKGLATACGAALILKCLEQGKYPSWDAQNLCSVALAEKLGYHFSHSYRVYEVQY